MEFTAQQIADFVGGTVEGNADKLVNNVANITESTASSLVFLDHPKYEPYLYTAEIGVAMVNKDFHIAQKTKATLIRVADSRKALSMLLREYTRFKNQKEGIEHPCFLSKDVNVPESAYIGAFAYIGKGVHIGEHVKIYPNCYVGDDVKIGADTLIYAGVKIYSETQIGERCIIHAGAVVGADGFGYTMSDDHVYEKVPHIGCVILEDDVEIGANTTIDRATMGETRISKGVKLDNLVQVAHNVSIGQHTVMAAQAGVAGSTKLGACSMFGGQAGIVGHLKLGDKVKVQAQSGVTKSLKEGQAVQGTPAIDYATYNKSYVRFKNLTDLEHRIRKLEKELKKTSEH